MANIRDGGTIILGVSERSGNLIPEGMSQNDMNTYNTDDIQAYINRFADPYIRLEMHFVTRERQRFIAIVVYEFDEVPIVCKKDGVGLRQGAVYTRPYRMVETCEVPSQTEMREIIDLATDKGVRRFLQRNRRVGLSPEGLASETDVEKFDEELEGL